MKISKHDQEAEENSENVSGWNFVSLMMTYHPHPHPHPPAFLHKDINSTPMISFRISDKFVKPNFEPLTKHFVKRTTACAFLYL